MWFSVHRPATSAEDSTGRPKPYSLHDRIQRRQEAEDFEGDFFPEGAEFDTDGEFDDEEEEDLSQAMTETETETDTTGLRRRQFTEEETEEVVEDGTIPEITDVDTDGDALTEAEAEDEMDF